VLLIFITAVLLATGGLMLWRFFGVDLRSAYVESKRLEEDLARMQEEIASSNLRFLEGEEAELVRVLFESKVTGSEYFNLVLTELGRHSESGGEIRLVSLSPPEISEIGERSDFSVEADLPFAELVSFLKYLEGAYPAFHINRLTVGRAEEKGLLAARISGAMYVLGGNGGGGGR